MQIGSPLVQANIDQIDATQVGESLDDEVVVGTLRQTGHGHHTDEPDAIDRDGEAATVAGHVSFRQSHELELRSTVTFGFEPDRIRRATEQLDHVSLAAGPIGIGGRRATHRMQEHGLAGEPHFDGDGGTTIDRSTAKVVAEPPRDILVER